jgi:Mg2+ and Co2+ transporter CorA
MNQETTSSATGSTITVVTAEGIRRGATPGDLKALVAGGKFFWIDIVGNDGKAQASLVGELGFDAADAAWAQRFGQTGRIVIDRRRLRVGTWLADPAGTPVEIHVLCSRLCLATVWDGDARILDEIRQHYAERASELEKHPYEAAAILLQLLLGTLHSTISEFDDQIAMLRKRLTEAVHTLEFSKLTMRLHRLRSAWAAIERYNSAVRIALVGIESLPEMDERTAAELNDYADQVEDVERRLQDRTRWGAEIVQDYSTAIAERQGDQIGRLTIVSVIFLPLTFLTGFFGMNFNWMIAHTESGTAFVLLGLVLPLLSVLVTALWLRRRRLI